MKATLQYRAARAADYEFLYRLHRAAVGPYVEKTWGWDEEWQADRFRRWVDLSTRQILMLDGVPIGCVGVQPRDDHLFVEYMAILPEYQRRGLGTRVVESILEQARDLERPVRLNVLRVNPARQLYERLGFRIVDEDEHPLLYGDDILRIAVSGSHNTGKTTLIGELIDSLPTFGTVDEPYYLLEEEGHAFAEPPCLEDFELQLERSIKSIVESEGDCLFDRCPFDFLAYLIAHDESEGFDVDRWLPEVRKAMQRLDLVVFVPIEDPDRVTASGSELGHLRRRADQELQTIVLDDRWSFGVPAIEVTGSPGERARQIIAYVEGGESRRAAKGSP